MRLLALCCIGVVVLFAGCGSGSDRQTNIKKLISDFETGTGVTYPTAEEQCMANRLLDKLSASDLKQDDPAKLSAAGQAEVASTLDACFSRASVQRVFAKSVKGQLPASVDVTCFSKAVAKFVKLGELWKLGLSNGTFHEPTLSKVQTAALRCTKK